MTPWVHAARAQYLTGRRAFSSLQPHDSSTATQTSTTPPPTGVPGDGKAADLQSKVLAQSGGKGKKVKGSSKSSSKKGSKKAKNRGASKGWRHAPTSSPHAPSTITRVTDAAKRGGKAVVEFIPKLAKMPFTVANAIGRGIKLTFTGNKHWQQLLRWRRQLRTPLLLTPINVSCVMNQIRGKRWRQSGEGGAR